MYIQNGVYYNAKNDKLILFDTPVGSTNIPNRDLHLETVCKETLH